MTKINPEVPVIFGEVLFDCFPDGNSVLGGAPFNVAWHLQAFGLAPLFVSSVGDDALGEKVVSAMQDWNMLTAGLQRDREHPTGSVDITFIDEEPRYAIVEHRAYDYIDAALLPTLPLDRLLYHGSLALRNVASRQALSTLKKDPAATIFMDVNLRDPWWDRQIVLEMIADADWVKLNEDELLQLSSGSTDIHSLATAFLNTHHLKGLVVTLGGKGAIALTDEGDGAEIVPSARLVVLDTVGAGDAFTAVFIAGLLHRWPLQRTMERAQEFASLIVKRQGATVHDRSWYQTLLSGWRG